MTKQEEIVKEVPVIVTDKPVRIVNNGKPFLYDLTQYGYGMRWPTHAVYTIPTGVYLDCLKKGLNGSTT